jgi:hypothetical protein
MAQAYIAASRKAPAFPIYQHHDKHFANITLSAQYQTTHKPQKAQLLAPKIKYGKLELSFSLDKAKRRCAKLRYGEIGFTTSYGNICSCRLQSILCQVPQKLKGATTLEEHTVLVIFYTA